MRRGVAVMLAACAAGCAHDTPYEKPLTPVRVEAVTRAQPASGVRYSAGIEPKTRVDLAFKGGGYIEALAMVNGRPIQDGDQVRQGMMLARIRPTDYLEKIDQAKSVLAEAEAGLAAARPALARAQQLYEAKSLTRPELEQAQATVASLEAKAEGARALVREAEHARDDTVLTSPIDGLILKRLVEVGSLVGPGVGGFVLADVSEVRAVFGAPDTMLRRLRLGATAPVTTDALPGREFTGRITKIAPAADQRSRIFDVELTVPNADGALRVGMIASIRVDPAPAPDAAGASSLLQVPLSAVVRSASDPEAYAVFVVEGTGEQAIARQRTVSLGDMAGSRITVTTGLREGDRVVVSGATIVSDGESVVVMR